MLCSKLFKIIICWYSISATSPQQVYHCLWPYGDVWQLKATWQYPRKQSVVTELPHTARPANPTTTAVNSGQVNKPPKQSVLPCHRDYHIDHRKHNCTDHHKCRKYSPQRSKRNNYLCDRTQLTLMPPY